MKDKVLLGFSGGMDSLRAAEVLAGQGYEVIALYLDMTGGGQGATARARAEKIGIQFIEEDVRQLFGRTVKCNFLSEYMAGRTPAPCTLCNTAVKWSSLSAVADRLGIGHIATGHYFGISHHCGKPYVTRPADRTKDQTYYLWGLGPDLLSRILTPMADILKADLRRGCTDPALKRESMGICFLGGLPPRDWLLEHAPQPVTPGDVMTLSGRTVGRHDGYPLYTIGQRRGFSATEPGYVVAIDPAANRLVIGGQGDLLYNRLSLGSWRATDMEELTGSDDISVVIRGIGINPEGCCRIAVQGDRLEIALDNPAWAPAKGQPAVLYRGDRVVGGGIVENYY